MNNALLENLEKLHTTQGGAARIRRNLQTEMADPVAYCIERIKRPEALIERKGKNWYVTFGDIVITVNAFSYTIITAHKAAPKPDRQSAKCYAE